ncbi:hypothetical protein [Sagittula sp. S175]|uniref:hypothetical protein n=1 Tax=Sagittula sp. S175 TaxID=3415129 RepID=UPI003C7E0583
MFEFHAGLVCNGEILFTRHFGHQTLERILFEIRRLSALEPGHSTLPEIVDLSPVERSDLDFAKMQAIVRLTAETARPGPDGKKIAVLAPLDVSYGLTRIHATLLEMSGSNVTSAVFRTEAEVLDWLGRPERAFADLEGIDRVAPLPDAGECCNL